MNETSVEMDSRAATRELAAGIEHAKDVAKGIAHDVSDAASYVRQKAESATTAVGGAMEDSGHYLREDGLNKIAGELTNLVRRNPLSALLAGVAVGILIARSTHRRSEPLARGGETRA